MKEIAYINGRFCALDEASISIEDRGFQFADGVYEVLAAHHGRPFRLPQHIDRLRESVAGLQLPFDPDAYGLERVILAGIDRAGFEHMLIYIQITRGVMPRSHICREGLEPTVVATFKPLPVTPPERFESGISVMTTEEIRWAKCYIKSVALLPNVMIKNQAVREGYHDALFVTADGEVREATSSNVFVVRGGQVYTPPVDEHILHGVTRGYILECAARVGVPIHETRVTRAELTAADEVFFSATTYNIMGVTRIDGRPVADGRVGPITRRLSEEAIRGIEATTGLHAVA